MLTIIFLIALGVAVFGWGPTVAVVVACVGLIFAALIIGALWGLILVAFNRTASVISGVRHGH